MLTISTRLSHHSNCQDAYRVGFREYRKSHDNYQFVTQVGSLQHAWESAGRKRLPCGSYHSACSTVEETRAHFSGEATWAFVTGIEQPLAESPTREGRRTVSEPSLWYTSSRPQAYVRGRCITGVDDMFIFLKEGIRKLSDHNMVRGNNTRFILIRWHLMARTDSVSRNLRQKQDRKE